jgi:hypothetical protein
MRHVGVFSLERDLHGHAAVHELRQRPNVSAHLIATDAGLSSGGIDWHLGDGESTLRSFDGTWISPAELDLIWWRRVNQPQLYTEQLTEDARDLADNEWRSGITGVVHEGFRGTWINDPFRDPVAGNKIVQLRAAVRAGLRVPKTLVSQQPTSVRRFLRGLGGSGIVKKLVGTSMKPLATVPIAESDLRDEDILLCPAMYQERIRGTRHVRANCFGESIHAVLIESPWLDWRRDLSVPFVAHDLDPTVERQLIEVLRVLGIRMGVMNLMYTPEGDVVWLELNTQGQFLFGEALAGVDLIGPFTDFLLDEITGGGANHSIAFEQPAPEVINVQRQLAMKGGIA